MAISILALPFFSVASISIDRSPVGKTVISSSPIDNDSDRARIPSAMRSRASAASAGDAVPSNSKTCLSPIVASPAGAGPDERPPRPSQLHGHVIRALFLLDLDLEDDELRRGQSHRTLPRPDRHLTGEHTPGELGEIEGRGVPARTTPELGRDRRGDSI